MFLLNFEKFHDRAVAVILLKEHRFDFRIKAEEALSEVRILGLKVNFIITAWSEWESL